MKQKKNETVTGRGNSVLAGMGGYGPGAEDMGEHPENEPLTPRQEGQATIENSPDLERDIEEANSEKPASHRKGSH